MYIVGISTVQCGMSSTNYCRGGRVVVLVDIGWQAEEGTC